MTLGLVIPWRDTSPERAALKVVVESRLREMLPEALYFEADSDFPSFNLAAARNAGVRLAQEAGCGTVVVCDADSIPEAGPVHAAIEDATDGLLHLPYTRLISLNPRGTRDYLRGRSASGRHVLLDWEDSVGGIYVSTPEAWFRAGGQDERFVEWGCEDTAFKLACDKRLGLTVRHPGALYHLYHPANRQIRDSALEVLAEYL